MRVVAFGFRGDPTIGGVVLEIEYKEIKTTSVGEDSVNRHSVEGGELVV